MINYRVCKKGKNDCVYVLGGSKGILDLTFDFTGINKNKSRIFSILSNKSSFQGLRPKEVLSNFLPFLKEVTRSTGATQLKKNVNCIRENLHYR